MRKSPLSDNRIFIAFETIFAFFASVISSVRIAALSVFRPQSAKALTPNRFLELLHFTLVTGPKKFWKKPTALAIGRSISTFLHFTFERDQRFKKNGKKGAFTLVEVVVAITLLCIVLVFAFESLGQIVFFKTRTADRIDLSRDLYSNIEQIVSYIKDGGNIDYEEYWNRNSVGLTLSGGHFALPTGFGNYGNGGVIGTTFGANPYYCLSGNSDSMGSGGCLTSHNTFAATQAGVFQRYGQYGLQFLDLNGDANGDNGDVDGDGNPLGDNDDEDLGEWPYAIGTGSTFPELYLFKKGDPSERILLRYRVVADPETPSSGLYAPAIACDPLTAINGEDNGCRGTLEILRLVARDFGMSHTGALTSSGLYDGAIDTWQCRSDFKCLGPENTPTGDDSEWVPLFSDDINIRSLSFDPYPRRDFRKNWKNLSVQSSDMIAPYVRLGISMGFSWKKRKSMPSNNPIITVSTTINLTP